ncbi:MlaD family protein [Nitriliruptor alkaliphilus]|uniref:MlaD family protein n=1 Tax=Nitriliruptor alkaliphilus TaxID=427918 RepID=UPI001FE0CB73|nr:MCE family protein [Nitriliruptor alkaliphilus]
MRFDGRRSWSRLVPLALIAGLIAACSPAGSDAMELTATFDDVGGLVTDAHVRAGDVPVGVISDIRLTDDMRAEVTMRVRRDLGLPERTEAVLGRTALLGEMFIDLRPIGEDGELRDGDVLEDTRIVTEFEELVASGDLTLSAISADQLAAAVETGAIAFGGRGGLLGRFIDDVNAFVGTYNEDADDLLALIDSLDGLTAALAPDAEVNAESLAVLERASQVLEEEDDRLLDALADLDELSTVGSRILRDHREEIDDSIRTLRIVLAQLTRVDGALSNLLTWLPRHNLHVPNGVVLEQGSGMHMGQVWLDFIVCGINDDPDNPAESCDLDNPSPGEPIDRSPRSEECYDDLEVCRQETDEANAR